MKCHCGRVFVNIDDIQFHQASYCPAAEEGVNFKMEQCNVIFRWQMNTLTRNTVTDPPGEVTVILSDLEDNIKLKQMNNNSSCYCSEMTLVYPGNYVGQLLLVDNVLALECFQIDVTSQTIDIQNVQENLTKQPSVCLNNPVQINDSKPQPLLLLPEPKGLISMDVKNPLSLPPPQIMGTLKCNYTLNRTLALKKKKHGCDKPAYVVKPHRSCTVISLNTASFELFTCVVEVHLNSKMDVYKFLPFNQQDKLNCITQDVIRVHNNDASKSHAFTINLYRTKNSVMVNGPAHALFRETDLPAIIKEIDRSRVTLTSRNAIIKQSLSKISPIKQRVKKRKTKYPSSPRLKKTYPSRSKVQHRLITGESSPDISDFDDSIEFLEDQIKNSELTTPTKAAPHDTVSFIEVSSLRTPEKGEASLNTVVAAANETKIDVSVITEGETGHVETLGKNVVLTSPMGDRTIDKDDGTKQAPNCPQSLFLPSPPTNVSGLELGDELIQPTNYVDEKVLNCDVCLNEKATVGNSEGGSIGLTSTQESVDVCNGEVEVPAVQEKAHDTNLQSFGEVIEVSPKTEPVREKRKSKKSSRLLAHEEYITNERNSKSTNPDQTSTKPPCSTTSEKCDVISEEEVEELYCICRKPYNKQEGDSMAYCEKCLTWLHYKCAGVSRDVVKELDKFVCPQCAAKLYEVVQELKVTLVNVNEAKARFSTQIDELKEKLVAREKENIQLTSRCTSVEKQVEYEQSVNKNLKLEEDKLTEKCKKLLEQQKDGIRAKQENFTLTTHQDTLRGTILAYETTINTQKAQIIDLENKNKLHQKEIKELELANSAHIKVGEALISSAINPVLPGETAIGLTAENSASKGVSTSDKKAQDKQIKNLMSNVKELEERVVYLTNESSELRKEKAELQLDLRREKQITNIHLKLTEDLAAAKYALKKSCSDQVAVEAVNIDDQVAVEAVNIDESQVSKICLNVWVQ